MKISYDYSELITELTEDLAEGLILLDSDIYIVRADEPIFENYRPVIDYYYIGTLSKFAFNEEDKFKAVKLPVSKVLEEMEEWNRLI